MMVLNMLAEIMFTAMWLGTIVTYFGCYIIHRKIKGVKLHTHLVQMADHHHAITWSKAYRKFRRTCDELMDDDQFALRYALRWKPEKALSFRSRYLMDYKPVPENMKYPDYMKPDMSNFLFDRKRRVFHAYNF